MTSKASSRMKTPRKNSNNENAMLQQSRMKQRALRKTPKEPRQKAQPGERPVVAGFDTIDDHLTSYAKKYKTDDLGFGTVVPSGKPATTAKQVLGEPDSNGASPEIERLLAEKRKEVGYETFENFRRSNVAVFRYYVLKPGARRSDVGADGPFYESAVNVQSELHSEEIILGRLQEIHQSKEFRKKYGPDYIIKVDQVLSERSPCFRCRGVLLQKSTIIQTANRYDYWVVPYKGNWIRAKTGL